MTRLDVSARPHLNLHLLRVFFTVAERRSFSRAAQSLFISQPAVSKAVRELEHQLGLPLIERGAAGAGVGTGTGASARGRRGVRLSESGQALFEHARGIFALERVAIEDIRARVALERGRLAIGASTTVAAYWLPDYVAAFMRQFPSVELQLRVGNTQAMSQALIDCDIDLALVEGTVPDARIHATHWRDDELQIIAHPAAPVARRKNPGVALLNAQTWLQREAGSGTRDVAEQTMAMLGIEPAQVIEMGSNESIAHSVAAGVGVAILPARVVRGLLRLDAVAALRQRGAPPLVRPLFRLQLGERAPSPLTLAFCATLEQALDGPQRLRAARPQAPLVKFSNLV